METVINSSTTEQKDAKFSLDLTWSIGTANKEEIRAPAALIGAQQRSGADEEPSEMFGPI